ncbi:Sjogren's syndrome/scleroderma autoantigen 1 family protein [Halostagnicola kamekurae]|uniref:Sjogren's syndrome/scleroderma autoantigen 1 (Autoantigen p27) n=1 Tax=Halostagnicola kamekurae TaxID=619731 RepID=A0A1I6P5X8_9EURY|nr:Sjogren's syndrome/scleroderma autoantigen 1 family protein [Halostagnicola kamekurae]SFS35585.1 Sjogren's syndrome/scleroderma autoantigen 1 (Autoantigen p27) [Halostagnicola kamekurae]
MSDFDKEAEREKLREKYEQDKREREATQRMSDLLLKGARMTNTHCNTCGDPLFQQNGTTFCPSCHGSPEGVEASPADESTTQDSQQASAPDGQPPAAGSEADTATPADASEPVNPSEAADASGPVDVSETTADASGMTANASETAADRSGVTATEQTSPAQPRDGSTERSSPDRPAAQPSETRDESPRTAPSTTPSRTRAGDDRSAPVAVEGDIEAGRDALVESLERFARKAAETDDPRYAKECLEAAREASEALSALR